MLLHTEGPRWGLPESRLSFWGNSSDKGHTSLGHVAGPPCFGNVQVIGIAVKGVGFGVEGFLNKGVSPGIYGDYERILLSSLCRIV